MMIDFSSGGVRTRTATRLATMSAAAPRVANNITTMRNSQRLNVANIRASHTSYGSSYSITQRSLSTLLSQILDHCRQIACELGVLQRLGGTRSVVRRESADSSCCSA